MATERRMTPRWKASSSRYAALVRHDDGQRSAATIVDVSTAGMGIRADRRCFASGMRVRIDVDMSGERLELQGAVRFVDRFFPRVGIRIESLESMEQVVRQAETLGFLMAEIKGDTLAVHGSLTLAAMKEFAAGARGCRKLDLSGVGAASIAGAGIVSSAARKGAKIDCCSAAIAPLFESLGICRAQLCVSAQPCDLPKTWPTRRMPSD